MIGKGAEEYAMAVKGLELYPMELRAYKSIGLVTAVGKAQDHSMTDVKWLERKESMEKWAMDLYGRKGAASLTTFEDKALSIWDTENRFSHRVNNSFFRCPSIIVIKRELIPALSINRQIKCFIINSK